MNASTNAIIDQLKQGGKDVDGIHFAFEGGQVRSLLSLFSYLGKGENREQYLGVKIPPSLLQSPAVEQAQAFAAKLSDGLVSNPKN